MLVIPAMDLLGGRGVRLLRGDYDHVMVYENEPLQRVQSWQSAGATRIHVIDLDAARDGGNHNHARVEEIVHYTGVEVEVGGGIRDEAAAEEWFARGANYVIFGTLAVENPDEVIRIASKYPGRIYVALDVRDGQVATHGWEQSGRRSLKEMHQAYAGAPLAGYIYTDIDRDGTMTGPDPAGMQQVTTLSTHPVIVSGGISAVEHLRAAAAAGAAGAIVGRALYEGQLLLRDAIAVIKGS
jgi:phosphoribosylformimino-5-aminoimidazole carboxamide ribotide isomerase